MLSGSWARYAPLSGILFVVLLVVSFFIGGDTPDSNDSTQKVIQLWSDNDSKQIAGAIVGAVATVPFLWFLSSLRSMLRVAEGGTGRLSNLAFAGGILLATGAVVDSSLQFAVAESVGDVPPLVTQSLSVLYSDFFFVFPIGVGTFALATGLVVLRTGVLAAWLGWLVFLLGIIAFVPLVGFFSVFVVFAWIVVVSIIMFRRGDPTVTPTVPAAV
jgi:hypothetical protein